MKRPIFAVISLLLVLGACSRSSEDTTPPDPEAVLAHAAERMGAVDTVKFTFELDGTPIYIDEDELLAFDAAEGRFAAPDRADAVLTVKAVGIPVKVGAVQIAGETWLTDPVSGAWGPAPAGFTFDIADLFDPSQGWRQLLAGGLTDAEYIGEEEVEGESLVHLAVGAPEDQVAAITAGLVAGQSVDGDLWIEPESGEVRKLTFQTFHGGEAADWTLTLSEYGAEVTIEPPDLG